ncbi:hypothetical protein GQ600_27567 [Phytophthora cactorum]|nr:hypothetical protein GQ600_27567 [Phytophthora cactorum]
MTTPESCTSTKSLDDVEGGGTIQTRGDLVTQERLWPPTSTSPTVTRLRSPHSHHAAKRHRPQCRRSSPDPGSEGTAPCEEQRCRASPRRRDVVVRLINETDKLDQVNLVATQARIRSLSDLRLLVVLELTGQRLQEG